MDDDEKREKTLAEVLMSRISRTRNMVAPNILCGLTALINNAVASTDKVWYEEHPNYWSGIWGGGLIILAAIMIIVADSEHRRDLFEWSMALTIFALLGGITMTVFAGFGIETDIRRQQGVNRPMCIIIAICGLLSFIVNMVALVELGRILSMPKIAWSDGAEEYDTPRRRADTATFAMEHQTKPSSRSNSRPHPLYAKSSYTSSTASSPAYTVTSSSYAYPPQRPSVPQEYIDMGYVRRDVHRDVSNASYVSMGAPKPVRKSLSRNSEDINNSWKSDATDDSTAGSEVTYDISTRMSALADSQLRQVALGAGSVAGNHGNSGKYGNGHPWSTGASSAYNNLAYSETEVESTKL